MRDGWCPNVFHIDASGGGRRGRHERTSGNNPDGTRIAKRSLGEAGRGGVDREGQVAERPGLDGKRDLQSGLGDRRKGAPRASARTTPVNRRAAIRCLHLAAVGCALARTFVEIGKVKGDRRALDLGDFGPLDPLWRHVTRVRSGEGLVRVRKYPGEKDREKETDRVNHRSHRTGGTDGYHLDSIYSVIVPLFQGTKERDPDAHVPEGVRGLRDRRLVGNGDPERELPLLWPARTFVLEWLSVDVGWRWDYAEAMPIVPVLGTDGAGAVDSVPAAVRPLVDGGSSPRPYRSIPHPSVAP